MSSKYIDNVVEDDHRYTMVQKGIMVAHDRSALNEYRKQAAAQEAKQNEINTLKDEVSKLSQDMSDIKIMLQKLLEKDS